MNLNREVDFLYASLNEFVKNWASGKQGSFSVECNNGSAWLQLGFQISQLYSNHSVHFHPTNYSPPRYKSEKRRERDILRTKQYKADKIKHSNQKCTPNKSKEDNCAAETASSTNSPESVELSPPSAMQTPSVTVSPRCTLSSPSSPTQPPPCTASSSSTQNSHTPSPSSNVTSIPTPSPLYTRSQGSTNASPRLRPQPAVASSSSPTSSPPCTGTASPGPTLQDIYQAIVDGSRERWNQFEKLCEKDGHLQPRT